MLAEGAKPKQSAVSTAKCDSDKRTTRPCHWDECMGIVQYASAMSLTAPCDPGSSANISCTTMGKVLYVAVKSSGTVHSFMDLIDPDPLRWERSWIMWYLPGHPSLGMRDKGKDWKCPNSCCISLTVSSPMYVSLLYELFMYNVIKNIFVLLIEG